MPKSQTTSDLNEVPPNIFEAIESGDINSVKEALQQGVDVNRKNSHGTPPLCLASRYGHKEIATLLLDRGANPDQQNNNGESPLLSAAQNGLKEIVTLLLERDANPNQQNKDGWAPLLLAAQNSHQEIITLLLYKGANPDLQNNNGDLSLHWAAQNGHKEIVALLLDRGANPDLQNRDGWAPLLLATQNSHKESITLLLEEGANPDLEDNNGWAPLHLANKNGHKEIVKLLSDKEAYSEQRLKRNKINKLWKYQPKLIYAEVKFLVEHVAVMNLWLTCKNLYTTEYTTEQTGHWINLPLDIKKTIIRFLAGDERTTKQLDGLYSKMTTDWKSGELSERALHSSKLFVENLFTNYLNKWGKLHTKTAQSFLDNGVEPTKTHDELRKNIDTFYKTFDGAPHITLTMKTRALFSHAKKETATSNSNNAKQTEQPQDKWKQKRTGYNPKGGFFRIAVTAQHKFNGIDSLTLKDDKGIEFTPPTPKGRLYKSQKKALK